jgi:hypothetical protein
MWSVGYELRFSQFSKLSVIEGREGIYNRYELNDYNLIHALLVNVLTCLKADLSVAPLSLRQLHGLSIRCVQSWFL